MGSYFFLKTPENTPENSSEHWPGIAYDDLGTALLLFLEAIENQEWAELKWSS